MEIFQIEATITELLLIVAVVAIVVQRLRIPYTVALVVVGLLLSFVQPIDVGLTPELILMLFVPPLIFEAALHLDLAVLRRNLPGILTLAIPGVVITTLIVGSIVSYTTGLALPIGLVFGALISATDPVAIISLFRTLGVPKRLSVIVEGESLFNDGAAIVVFSLMVGYAVSGQFSLTDGILDFVRVSVGGLAVGIALGTGVAWIISHVDDHLIEITLTVVLAFGSFLAAESLHFSGVLAVVAAGLLNGNLGLRGMSPTTRIVLNNFWEFVAFLANSLIFLIIGLDINVSALTDAWQPIVWAIVAVLLARIIVIYVLGGIINRFTEPISLGYQHVMVWGGLRGAIGLALALSLPFSLGADRRLLLALTFGVVLFTLFVQGTTINFLLHKLGLVKSNSQNEIEYERRHARLATMQAAESHLQQMHRHGLISAVTWDKIKPEMQEQVADLAEDLRSLLREDPKLASEELDTARLEILRARRSTLYELRSHGIISEPAFDMLALELDDALSRVEAPPLDMAPAEEPAGDKPDAS